MSSNQHPLYFIAIIPPSPIKEELQTYKEHFRDKYGSKASLNSPPHITLHMPFKFSNKKLDRMLKSLARVAADNDKFELELRDFSAFAPRVIYADVVKSDQLITLQKSLVEVCRKDLKLDNANYRNQAFHPHITLAFRDLKKPEFAEVWQVFQEKKYGANFLVDHFYLMQHDGSKWQVHTSFDMATKNISEGL